MERVEDILLLHRARLLAFIERRVEDPDLAEDILQEGLVRAMHAAGDLHEEERLIAWFYRVLNNAIIDVYRRRSTEAKYLETYGRQMVLESVPEDETELCACFRELLPALKPEYASLIESMELQPGDPGQVARELGIEPNNLKVRRHRARQALKERLEETCRVCAEHGCLDCTCRSAASVG